MDLLSVIRRWRDRDELSIREISRRTGLSRHTIRKYLSGEIVEPKCPQRKTVSKLDPFTGTLATWLERESRRYRKRRRSLKMLHRDLVALGFDGSYDRVAAFARNWRQQQREADNQASRGTYVPLIFAPGEAFPFDWSEDWARVGHGKQRQVNARFQAMASHFMFETDLCNPAAGWEKGQIEKNVRDARFRLWHDAPAFSDLSALNVWLEQRCQALWHEIQHPEQTNRTISEVYADERSALMAMPPPFDGFIEHAKRGSPTCLIVFERNRYSVPAALANQAISLRVYADQLMIVARAEVIATHQRIFSRDHSSPGQTSYDWRHYLAVVQRKLGALRNGAPFATLPESSRYLQSVLLKQPGGDRQMADILALVLQHDEHLVEQAVGEAIAASVLIKTHILNRLSRWLDKPPPARLEPPPALVINAEPIANTQRNDNLREARHVD